MAGWPVESFVFLAIHPVVSAMGTFAWGDPYLRMWPLRLMGLVYRTAMNRKRPRASRSSDGQDEAGNGFMCTSLRAPDL
jgi:hypothetical protein